MKRSRPPAAAVYPATALLPPLWLAALALAATAAGCVGTSSVDDDLDACSRTPLDVSVVIEIFGRIEAEAPPPDCAVETGETVCELEPDALAEPCDDVTAPWCSTTSLSAVTSNSAFAGWYDHHQLIEQSPGWELAPDPDGSSDSTPCYLHDGEPCRAVFGQSAVVRTAALGVSSFTTAAGTQEAMVFAGRASGDVELGGTVYSLGESSAYVAAVDSNAAPLWLLPMGDAVTPVAVALSPAQRSLLVGTLLGTVDLPSGSVSADQPTPLLVQLSPAGDVAWHRLLQLEDAGFSVPAARGIAFVSDGVVLLGLLRAADEDDTLQVRKLDSGGQDAWSLDLPVPAGATNPEPLGVYLAEADEIWVAWQIWDVGSKYLLSRVSADGVLSDTITLSGATSAVADVLIGPDAVYLLMGDRVQQHDLTGAHLWTRGLPVGLYSGRMVLDDHGRIVVAGNRLVALGSAIEYKPDYTPLTLWAAHALSTDGELLWTETEMDPVAHTIGSGHIVDAGGRVLLLRAAADAASQIRAIVLESGL